MMSNYMSAYIGIFCIVLIESSWHFQDATSFFIDISNRSGITHANYAINPSNPIPINDHSRLAFVDINGDHWDDIVMHSLYPNLQSNISLEHLVFVNNQNGTFMHFSDDSGLRFVQAGFFLFGDIDNDGDQDLFAGLDYPINGFTNQIYLNDGFGHFSLFNNSGVEMYSGSSTSASASFGDFNSDGYLDLYIGNGGTLRGVADQLFFGNGDGTFLDVTTANLLGINPKQPTNGIVVCDYDNDGDADIFVSTYGVSIQRGHNILWENDGTGKFKNVAANRGISAQATGNYWLLETGYGNLSEPDKDSMTYMGSNGFGIDCEDINGDGLNDIFLATISHPVESDYNRKWSDPTQLLINHIINGTHFMFVNEFLLRDLPFNEGDIDAGIVDFDNDGRLDLALTRDTKYEAKYTTFDQLSWFGLMHQMRNGKFESFGAVSGINDLEGIGKGSRMKGGQNFGWSDIDHDGDLDLLVGARDQGGGRANFLFENRIGQNQPWMKIKLVGDGVKVNRDAIGTRVTLRFSNWIMMREVKSSRGTYCSADSRTLHFGLGDFGEDFTIEIRWPNNKTDVYNSIISSHLLHMQVYNQRVMFVNYILHLLILLFCNSCFTHPTVYPHVNIKREQNYLKKVSLTSPPPIISYHIHITYTLFNPASIKEAITLRTVTRQQFRDYLGPDCPGRYDYGYLCMINDHDIENTTLIGGPFVSGEWSIFVPLGYYPVIIPWLLQNRGNLSMLVHPNTGYEYEDHSIWAMWAGENWPLDMSIFEQGTQTNEFGHYPGDKDNPVCLQKGVVCGDNELGPSALCCYNLLCQTAEIISNINSNYTIHRCA